MAVEGWNWESIVQQQWYIGNGTEENEGVAEEWKEIVLKQEGVLQRAFDGVVGWKDNGTGAESGGGRRRVDRSGSLVSWVCIILGWVGVLWAL
jgi:hypothetical protein